MATTEVDSRLKDFDLQGFHQIIAISQDKINANLRVRFDPELQPELLSFKHEIPMFGLSEATLDPPNVEVCTESNIETKRSRFFLNFKTGSYKYKTSVETGDVETLTIDGWKVPFFVAYDEQTLAKPPDSSHPDLKSKWAKLEPGKYSLSRIIMFLGSAPLSSIDWDRASCPGLSKDNDPYGMKLVCFKMFLGAYLSTLQKDPDALTLGYTIKEAAPDPTDKAPTFPPTAVKIQNYRYQPCSDTQQAINGITVPPNSRDAFVFMEMTGGADMPHDELQRKGNLIIGNMSGALVFSKELFFNKYLVENALSTVNVSFLDMANDLMKWVDGGNWDSDWLLTNGSREEALPDVKWTIDESKAKLSWKGQKSYNGLSMHRSTDSSLETELTTQPRANKIIITSKMKLGSSMSVHSMGGHGGAGGYYKGTDGVVNLTIEFVILADEDGTLHVQPEEKIDLVSADDSRDASLINLIFGKENHQVGDFIKGKLHDVVRTKHIGDAIAADLNEKKQLVFPGSGTFSYKDPKFSDAGDLLITLDLVGKDIEKDKTLVR
ncbi:hypothetical protein SMACR_08930 [Sordaria macrospora]|uniref:WGS project CABT00000000 data, contig 2.70 n=2 Tax=Sordaria macrospora TaxID=5147 RepID=F7WB51_SORMK|nr:uncharacterized protein SMAC_08930 [Sordaria macrospora k-hell]KAA8631105.1 hypothetical protein SMACR_08930 [Sordaria macrospora]WPJ63940.1 hypothetical protein SMAC4_08930 [Sordaria macrospora]CCC14343.1 unnamed protein product [Sordaria macrospora k-hell]